MNEEEKKKLFMALVTGKGVRRALERIVLVEEHIMQKDGGEPDMEHLLCLRLLEVLQRHIVENSMVYDEEWREHVMKKREDHAMNELHK